MPACSSYCYGNVTYTCPEDTECAGLAPYPCVERNWCPGAPARPPACLSVCMPPTCLPPTCLSVQPFLKLPHGELTFGGMEASPGRQAGWDAESDEPSEALPPVTARLHNRPVLQ